MAPKAHDITRDCTHGGRHKHGTSVMYEQDRCRCQPCSRAKVAIEQRKTRDIAYGRWEKPFVDAAPAQAHARQLIAAGMPFAHIAARSGVPERTLRPHVYPSPTKHPTTIRRENADAILGVTFVQSGGRTIPAVGTHRRVQALMANGWSMQRLSRRLGHSPRWLWQILEGNTVYPRTARKIAALYDELWNQEPPRGNRGINRGITLAKDRGRRDGWALPLAWDDDTIDDPNAEPSMPEGDRSIDEVAIAEAVIGRPIKLSKAERIKAVEILTDRGMSAVEIARHLRINQRYVNRDRAELREMRDAA